MQVIQLLEMARNDFDQCIETLKTKNNDYASTVDALKNFKQSSVVANITPEQSILVLIGTKISRLTELITSDKSAKNEAVEDTILDMINYLILLKAALDEKRYIDRTLPF